MKSVPCMPVILWTPAMTLDRVVHKHPHQNEVFSRYSPVLSLHAAAIDHIKLVRLGIKRMRTK